MSINMFDTRTMTRALEQMYTPKTFLRDFFFGNTELHSTQYVDIDIEKGSRRVAAYVSPQHEGKKVDKLGYETKSYKVPYTKQKMVTTAEEFLKREAGQTMYTGGDTSGARAQRELGKNLRELSEMIDRLEEKQASEAMRLGTVTAEGEGISDVITFGFASSHLPVLTSTAKWDDHTNADPIANLESWVEQIRKDSGLEVANVVMDRDAVKNMISCTKFKNSLDNRRITLGQIEPSRYNSQGVKYWGYINEVGVDVWSYSAYYYDEITETNVPYLDSGRVLMAGEGARLTRHYGAIQDLENTAITARFAKSWITKDPSARWVMVQAAPLCVPHQIDAILSAKVM